MARLRPILELLDTPVHDARGAGALERAEEQNGRNGQGEVHGSPPLVG